MQLNSFEGKSMYQKPQAGLREASDIGSMDSKYKFI